MERRAGTEPSRFLRVLPGIPRGAVYYVEVGDDGLPLRRVELHPDGRVARLQLDAAAETQEPVDSEIGRIKPITEQEFLRRWDGPRTRLPVRLAVTLLVLFVVLMVIGAVMPGVVGGVCVAVAWLGIPAVAGIAYWHRLRELQPEDRAASAAIRPIHLGMIAAICGVLGLALVGGYSNTGRAWLAVAAAALLAWAVVIAVRAVHLRQSRVMR